jgi:hypothetical protein
MKLLKRSADSANKSVVLITSEHALLPLAGAAGLHAAKNLQSRPEIPDAPAGSAKAPAAPEEDQIQDDLTDENDDENEDLPDKYDYGKPIGILAAKHAAENPETIDLDEEEDANEPKAEVVDKSSSSKNKVPNFDRFRVLLGAGGVALIALIVFLIMAITVWPKANITISTASEPLSADFNLTATTKAETLDNKTGTIPAKLETTNLTGSQTVNATGQKNNGDKATGSVDMSAKKCSGNPFVAPDDVPAGTGISVNGLTYITQQTASFHGTGTSGSCYTYSSNPSVSISASAAGSKYNVSGENFSIPSRSDVAANGSTSGGTDDIVTILSQSDVDSAKQKLTSGTSAEDFKKDFEKKLTDQGEYVLPSTLKVGEAKITSSPAVGEPASTANVNIKVSYSVLTVKKDDLSQAIQAKLTKKIDKKKQKLSDSFFEDAEITVQSQSSPKVANLRISENTTDVPIINVASVKAQAKGQKVGDVKAAINSWPGVKNVDVNLSPFWVSKVPGSDGKITVVLKQVKANPTNSEQP